MAAARPPLRWPWPIGRHDAAATVIIAYIRASDVDDTRMLLEALGQQLLPEGRHWSVVRYPTQWQALDYLRQTLHTEPTPIVLDQLERWPSEQDEAFDQFWKQLLDDWPDLRLLGLGRIGPPSFAPPWTETVLSPLCENDAIAMIGQILIEAREMPPNTDSGENFRQLRDVAALAGGIRAPYAAWPMNSASQAGRGLRAAASAADQVVAHSRRRPTMAALPESGTHLAPTLQPRPGTTNSARVLPGGINRIALGHAMSADTLATDTFCARIIDLGLAEDQGLRPSALRSRANPLPGQSVEPGSAHGLAGTLASGMERLAVLYQQYFKDNARATRLLRLELPNLLALLRDHIQHAAHERVARMAVQLEHMLADLGLPPHWPKS